MLIEFKEGQYMGRHVIEMTRLDALNVDQVKEYPRFPLKYPYY